jgi:Zn-dependent peptidase ImmA (M78 family)
MAKKTKKKTKLGFEYVEVLGHTFKIIETDKDEDLLSDRQVALGLIKYFDSVIYIDTRQSMQNIKQTFFHELLHAIDFISHNERVEYDEETVNVLARGLMTVRTE